MPKIKPVCSKQYAWAGSLEVLMNVPLVFWTLLQ